MEKSESLTNISKALINFHVKVEAIKKDSTNPFYQNKYASLSKILEAINRPLNESDLSFVQFPDGENSLTSILLHTSGEYIQSSYCMKPVKDDPQGRGSALTYMRRYAVSAILGLNIEEEDDDGNGASKAGEKNGIANSTAAKNELPWMNEGTKEFEGAIKKLKEGTSTIEGIKKVRRLSKAVETKLLELSKN